MLYNRIPITIGEFQLITGPTVSYQYDIEQYLVFNSVTLPDYYTVDFCNVGDSQTVTITGTPDGVRIPDELLLTGRDIKAYVVLTGTDEGAVETRYEITLPVRNRPMRQGVEPTPEERLEIETLVNALNDGVERAEDAATEAEGHADRAETAADNAQSAVEHYPKIEDGYWYVWLNGGWVNTGVKAEGVDGKGIVSVTGQKTSTSGLVDTYTLTVTYTDSTTDTITFTVTNGRDGTDGTDGVSPEVTIETITGGHRVTITDKDHPTGQSFDVMDGEVSAADLKAVADSKAPVIIDTASGAIASFPDGADNMPVKSLVCQINPQQDLHGQDAPYPGGGGINKWDFAHPVSAYNASVTENSNGTFAVSGTTANAKLFYRATVTPNQIYSIQLAKSNESGNTSVFGYGTIYDGSEDTGTVLINDQNLISGKTFTPTGNTVYIAMKVTGGSGSGSATVTAPIINLGSTTATYAPWENMCPISGWTGVNLTRDGVNLLPESEYTTNASGVTNKSVAAYLKLSAGTKITASGYAEDGTEVSGSNTQIQLRKGSTSLQNISPGQTVTLANDIECDSLLCYTNATLANKKIFLQLELGSTASAYQQYQGDTVSVSWQTEAGTVYGGNINLTTGVLTVDRKILDMGTATWSLQAGTETQHERFVTSAIASEAKRDSFEQGNISSILKEDGDPIYSRERDNCFIVAGNGNIYAECTQYQDAASFKSAMNGQTIVYYLATPITVQLDPVTVSTLLGVNNIWHDANGDVSVDYCADTKLYLEKLTQPTEDDMIANSNIAANKFFMIGNTLYFSTAAIAQGATIVPGTNCNKVSLADALNTLNA